MLRNRIGLAPVGVAVWSLCFCSSLTVLFVAGVRAQGNATATDDAATEAGIMLNADAVPSLVALRNPDADVTQMAEAIENNLLSAWFSYGSLDRVIQDFEFWQRFELTFAPPEASLVLFAQRARLRIFDPTGFPVQVLSGLIPETNQYAVTVYRIVVCEDPVTRDRVLYNAAPTKSGGRRHRKGMTPGRTGGGPSRLSRRHGMARPGRWKSGRSTIPPALSASTC